MEGNSSIDFWSASCLQQFQFERVFKKNIAFYFDLFFSNLFYKPTNTILGLATPLPFPLPIFLVGLALWCQASPRATHATSSLAPLLIPM
jgi:hypothetical protein